METAVVARECRAWMVMGWWEKLRHRKCARLRSSDVGSGGRRDCCGRDGDVRDKIFEKRGSMLSEQSASCEDGDKKGDRRFGIF